MLLIVVCSGSLSTSTESQPSIRGCYLRTRFRESFRAPRGYRFSRRRREAMTHDALELPSGRVRWTGQFIYRLALPLSRTQSESGNRETVRSVRNNGEPVHRGATRHHSGNVSLATVTCLLSENGRVFQRKGHAEKKYRKEKNNDDPISRRVTLSRDILQRRKCS